MRTWYIVLAAALAAGACATARTASTASAATAPSPAPADTGAVRELSAVERAPVLLNANAVQQTLSSRYPAALRDAHVEGSVSVRLVVGVDGRPARIRVLQSGGRPEFDEAALAVVRSMRFSPATVGGRPVAVFVIVPVSFSVVR